MLTSQSHHQDDRQSADGGNIYVGRDSNAYNDKTCGRSSLMVLSSSKEGDEDYDGVQSLNTAKTGAIVDPKNLIQFNLVNESEE